MKFFAFFALAALFAVAAAYPYEYEPEYAATEYTEGEQIELDRSPRSYGKPCKAVLVACGPIVQKVKCKGKY